MYTADINCTIKNMRLDKTPLVLCNTLFKVTKNRTDIEGYWLDSEGKVHFDYIELKEYFAIDSHAFRLAVQRLLDSGELCVFYKDFYNNGVLEYKGNKSETIRTRLEFISSVKPSHDKIQGLLKEYGGLTLYKLDYNCYVIEVYPINYPA